MPLLSLVVRWGGIFLLVEEISKDEFFDVAQSPANYPQNQQRGMG